MRCVYNLRVGALAWLGVGGVFPCGGGLEVENVAGGDAFGDCFFGNGINFYLADGGGDLTGGVFYMSALVEGGGVTFCL